MHEKRPLPPLPHPIRRGARHARARRAFPLPVVGVAALLVSVLPGCSLGGGEPPPREAPPEQSEERAAFGSMIPKGGLALPRTTSEAHLKSDITVAVGRTGIALDGIEVLSLAPDGESIPDELLEDGLVKLGRSGRQDVDWTFLVLADESTPYAVLEDVLRTFGQSGYTAPVLVALDDEGEPRRVPTAHEPRDRRSVRLPPTHLSISDAGYRVEIPMQDPVEVPCPSACKGAGSYDTDRLGEVLQSAAGAGDLSEEVYVRPSPDTSHGLLIETLDAVRAGGVEFPLLLSHGEPGSAAPAATALDGSWSGEVNGRGLRLELERQGGKVSGTVRIAIGDKPKPHPVDGSWDAEESRVTLTGPGGEGRFVLTLSSEGDALEGTFVPPGSDQANPVSLRR